MGSIMNKQQNGVWYIQVSLDFAMRCIQNTILKVIIGKLTMHKKGNVSYYIIVYIYDYVIYQMLIML